MRQRHVARAELVQPAEVFERVLDRSGPLRRRSARRSCRSLRIRSMSAAVRASSNTSRDSARSSPAPARSARACLAGPSPSWPSPPARRRSRTAPRRSPPSAAGCRCASPAAAARCRASSNELSALVRISQGRSLWPSKTNVAAWTRRPSSVSFTSGRDRSSAAAIDEIPRRAAAPRMANLIVSTSFRLAKFQLTGSQV